MKTLALVTFLLINFTCFTQEEEKEAFEGRIEYDILYDNVSEEVAKYSSFLPKSMTIEVEGTFSRIIMGKQGDLNNVVITDSESNTTLTLTDQMGKKIAIVDKKEKSEIKEFEITYYDESKEIAGYECFKASTTVEGNKVTYFYTEELPSIKTSYVSNLKGYPMEIIIETSKFTTIQRVKSISFEDVEEISLDIPKDYSPMTPQQLNKTLNGSF
jgi:GLPGLI family protein